MRTKNQDPVCRVQILAAQKAACANALEWNQEYAAKGNAYDLLRMGERYRAGDGVRKDLTKAHAYFTKASAAGSHTATAALSKLNQVATGSPATK